MTGGTTEQLPDGSVICTSPADQIHRRSPGGADLHVQLPNQSAATGLVSAQPASHEFATAIDTVTY